MKRVRQESAEVYEVTAREVAKALGVLYSDEDSVTFEYKYGELFRLTVKVTEDEDYEMQTPLENLAESIGLGFFTPVSSPPGDPGIQHLVIIPPYDQFGPGDEPQNATLLPVTHEDDAA